MTLKQDYSTLARFIGEANRYPMLTPEREHTIATAWQARNDPAALDELIGSHLRLVITIARRYSGYGLPLADLVAEGNIGLLQAAKKFDPERGFRFTTYAIWWIRAAMQDYVLHSWSLVRIGTNAAQKKLFFNLNRLKAKLGAFEQGELAPGTVATIAAGLNVPEHEVVEMNRRIGSRDNSLNASIGDADIEWIDVLTDERPTQETVLTDHEEAERRHNLLAVELGKLKPREREIVTERHLSEEPATLETLSNRYALSRERIRQIEMRAVQKLKKGCEAGTRRQLYASASLCVGAGRYRIDDTVFARGEARTSVAR